MFCILTSFSHAQWWPDQRLTNDPASSFTSRNSQSCITSGPGTLVHACWWDDRSGNNEIYYKRSTDRGLTWSTDTRLTEDTARSWTPSIAVGDSVVYLVWCDTRDGVSGEVYCRRSTDAGVTWQPDARLSFDTAKSEVPAVAAAGAAVHLVWRDSRDARFYWEIYYRSSTDAGQTWSGESRLTTATSIKWNPSVATAGRVVHVVWADNRDGDWEVYYKRSTDCGSTWEPDVRLTTSVFAQQWPCVVAADSLVVIAWTDGEDVNGELYCARSRDGGASWLPACRITDGLAQPGMWAPSLALSGDRVHAVWPDGRDGNFEVYYNCSTDRGLTWGDDQRLTQDQAVSNYPCVEADDSVVHLLWSDYRDGVFPEVYYKRNPTGSVGAEESPKPQALSFKPPATIVRSVLRLPVSPFTIHTSLFDMTGRQVMALHPGPNDVSRLSPGVYFVRAVSGRLSAVSCRKVVLTE